MRHKDVLPSYATARDVTEFNDNAGVVEGLQEGTSDLDCIDADRAKKFDWNESDGVGKTGERFMDQFPPDSDLDEGDHAIEAEDESNAAFISEESIA
jgi:hypothetical protein